MNRSPHSTNQVNSPLFDLENKLFYTTGIETQIKNQYCLTKLKLSVPLVLKYGYLLNLSNRHSTVSGFDVILFHRSKSALRLQRCSLQPIYVTNDPSFKTINLNGFGRCAVNWNPLKTRFLHLLSKANGSENMYFKLTEAV